MCIYMVNTYNCIYVTCVLSFYVCNSFVRIDLTRPLLGERMAAVGWQPGLDPRVTSGSTCHRHPKACESECPPFAIDHGAIKIPRCIIYFLALCGIHDPSELSLVSMGSRGEPDD